MGQRAPAPHWWHRAVGAGADKDGWWRKERVQELKMDFNWELRMAAIGLFHTGKFMLIINVLAM